MITPFVFVDKCGLDPQLVADMAEMCSIVSQSYFGLPDPVGYGVSGLVRVASSPTDIRPGEWVMNFEPVPSVPGALGFHDVAENGMPQGHCFPTIEDSIADFPITVSHEFFEMLGDPDTNTCVVGTDGVIRCREACDAVEAISFSFPTSDGKRWLKCSDWVTPAYFDGRSGVMDHCGNVLASGVIAPGGYAILWTPGQGWTQQQNGELRGYRKRLNDLGLGRLAKRQRTMPDGPA